ncbi:MAG TPA: efflux RND transporter periplasmic adaptor subunit [Phycisphaerae bacterium]|nr:HlyD family efflux transporter periplasmic adaptor subunit [Phycisphaerae bacterium]HOB73996.1 efflux RND transporter periplasmic adaptor subunit [Phycisphaerae bacterium]HOL26204.1 efflux RND transporter periplasmic adaptor subunit [Phycisphaerae bacterium]HPP20191.1 efflux RND transporter periplasmic adaptor subunit [Phycisphaerae bacterium]HQE44750.1 efflux RND transporter periplasmic adaptor subunit [Phycisphaerae bacterium]
MSVTDSTEVLPRPLENVREAAPVQEPQTDWAPLPPSSGKSKRNRLRLIAIAAAIVLALGTFAVLRWASGSNAAGDIQLFKVTRRSFPIVLQETGELKAAHVTDVRCELEGRPTIIWLVPEGTHAKKGDLLVELASDEIDDKIRDADIKVATTKAAYEAAEKEFQILKDQNQSDISKAKLALWLAEQALEKYEKGDGEQLKQADELALKKAENILDRAQKKLKDSIELHKKGFITRLDLENDEFEVIQAKMELAKAELALEVTTKYTIPMAVEEKKSAVEEARKELARTERASQASEAKAAADVAAKKSEYDLNVDKLKKLHDQKQKARILAPADGLVVYYREEWDDQPRINVGAQTVERARLIELPDTSRMKVVLRVHEAKVEMISKGLPATVEIEGFTGQRFTGHVSNIAVLANARHWSNRNLKEYETEILLDGTFTQLKPGATARAEILVTELKDVLAVPVQAIFAKGGKYFVFLDEGEKVRPVEVKVGLASTEYVEIKEGLSEGATIRLAVTDEMKLLLPQEKGPDAQGEEPRDRREAAASRPAVAAPASRPAARPAGGAPASRPRS